MANTSSSSNKNGELIAFVLFKAVPSTEDEL